MQFRKDKSAIVHIFIFFLCLLFIYSGYLSNLFVSLFQRVYYGQLVELFKFVFSSILWTIELVLLCLFARRKLNLHLIHPKEEKKPYTLFRILLLYAITLFPILLISCILGWKLKIEYDFGERITNAHLIKQLCSYGALAIKMIFIVIMIREGQTAFEKIWITKYQIPWGGILLMLTYGVIELIIDFQMFSWFYLFFCFIYGVLYLMSQKKFSVTYVLSYLIYLL